MGLSIGLIPGPSNVYLQQGSCDPYLVVPGTDLRVVGWSWQGIVQSTPKSWNIGRERVVRVYFLLKALGLGGQSYSNFLASAVHVFTNLRLSHLSLQVCYRKPETPRVKTSSGDRDDHDVCGLRSIFLPKGLSTQYLKFLFPEPIQGMGFREP